MSSTTVNFALGLLQKFDNKTKAAREADARKKREAAAARARAQQLDREKEKERNREEADKMVSRNSRSRRKASVKRKSAASSKTKKVMSPTKVAMKLRGVPIKREADRSRPKKAPGPVKPLPGMEFVVRKTKKEEIKVPHTSDYSDMFGDEFLKGIDMPCLTEMKEESAKATKDARRILKERREKADRLMKEAEESKKREAEAEKLGIKRDKHEWRKRAADKEYVTVDKPPNLMTPSERQRFERELKRGKASSRGGESSSKGLGVAKGRVIKVDPKAASAREVARKKAALRDRILAATGGRDEKPKAAIAASSRSPERRPVPAPKQKRYAEWGRDGYASRKGPAYRNERVGSGKSRASPKRSRYDDDRGYNSEDWSDEEGGNDSEDSEDLFGIDALEKEEEMSAKLARLEDKKERMREKKHKLEKERRRKEFEQRR